METPNNSSSEPSTVLFTAKYLRLIRRGRWEFADRIGANGAVVIVAVTPEGNLLLTEQFRAPVGAPVIELPAGISGDEPGHETEALARAAQRELLEETGYDAEEFIHLTDGPPSAGLSSEIITFFYAKGLNCVGPGGGSGSENIRVHHVAVSAVGEWLQARVEEKILIDPKVYAGLFFVAQLQRLTS